MNDTLLGLSGGLILVIKALSSWRFYTGGGTHSAFAMASAHVAKVTTIIASAIVLSKHQDTEETRVRLWSAWVAWSSYLILDIAMEPVLYLRHSPADIKFTLLCVFSWVLLRTCALVVALHARNALPTGQDIPYL